MWPCSSERFGTALQEEFKQIWRPRLECLWNVVSEAWYVALIRFHNANNEDSKTQAPEVIVKNKDSTATCTRDHVCHITPENLSTFWLCPEILPDTKNKSNEPINFPLNFYVQTMAWVWLASFKQIDNDNQKQVTCWKIWKVCFYARKEMSAPLGKGEHGSWNHKDSEETKSFIKGQKERCLQSSSEIRPYSSYQ